MVVARWTRTMTASVMMGTVASVKLTSVGSATGPERSTHAVARRFRKAIAIVKELQM